MKKDFAKPSRPSDYCKMTLFGKLTVKMDFNNFIIVNNDIPEPSEKKRLCNCAIL